MNTDADRAATVARLDQAATILARRMYDATEARLNLRGAVLSERSRGVLTVPEIAEAVGCDRNYVDSIWSTYGDGVKGKQTRVVANGVKAVADAAAAGLRELAALQVDTTDSAVAARGTRDSLIIGAYKSKILGPSAIAEAACVDRNHVLRIVRKAGVAPAWRPAGTVRNQHSAAK